MKSFAEVPREAERVIFFPRAAGGALERTASADGARAGHRRDPARGAPLGARAARRSNAALARARLLWAQRRRASAPAGYDPGRERRAELRARALLRSCIEERDWAMYRDLGFLRVWGAQAERERGGGTRATPI